MSERYSIRFTGDVQGVGFRYATLRVAERFDVTGWVRNMPDGSVLCIAEGSRGELDRFVAAVEQAMTGHVAGSEVAAVEATGEFADFTVRM